MNSKPRISIQLPGKGSTNRVQYEPSLLHKKINKNFK